MLMAIVLTSHTTFTQQSNEALTREISELKTLQEISNYWNQIHLADQSVRGKVTEAAQIVDRENVKKIFLMCRYHGYPSGFCYGCSPTSPDQNNFTPNIVVIHNRVSKVNELFLPILKKAYEDGKANEFWYIHNLRGMVRDRYGRDFYEKTQQNIPLFYDKLAPFIQDSLIYDLELIDALNKEYDENISKILNSELVLSKKKKGTRNNIYKTTDGVLYWQKLYPDGSFNYPQEIYFDKENGCLRYALLNEEIKTDILVKNVKTIHQ